MTVGSNNTLDFPNFPCAIIRGLAKKFVDLYAPIREVPEQFLWLAFITYLGNVISQFVKLDIDYSEPRLFGVVIGQSARTKKSTGNNLARDLFRVAFKGWERCVVEGFGSAEGLLTYLSKHPNIPTILHLDEINILAQKTNFEGTVGISALNKLFEGHNYDHTLAGQKSYQVKSAYLSMLGASTLDDFRKTWVAKHTDAGFFSRLLIVGADYTGRRVSRPPQADKVALDTLATELRKRVEQLQKEYRQNGGPVEISLDPDAAKIWDSFYCSFGEGKEWDRIDTYGFRLMAIQAVLEGVRCVTKAIAQQVVEFLQYEVAVRWIVQPIIAENAAAEMEELIMRYLPSPNEQ